jgi:imidazole glycerol phosphate synthase glutamine amidotransferase subunit
MIAIVDYGMGNLRNVRRACSEIGADATVTADAGVIARADRVILPGVGAFGEAVKRIESLGLRAPILAHANAGKPLLGICLGMQLLCRRSEESAGVRGLCLLEGEVRKFEGSVKTPHIGWNDVACVNDSPIFPAGCLPGVFYFVHSYRMDVLPFTTALTHYGSPFSAAVQKGNIFGVQFHPEKSQAAGLSLLRAFAGLPVTDAGARR